VTFDIVTIAYGLKDTGIGKGLILHNKH